MTASRLRNALIAIAAAASVSACADGYGYGGLDVGYGTAGYHDPYYNPYVAADQYDFYASGYQGFGQPYWGWYNGYYYPGSGFYVYDRWRRPHRWRDHDRRHWEGRRSAWRGGEVTANWRDFRRDRREWRGDRGRGYRGRTVPIERGLREANPDVRGQAIRQRQGVSARPATRNPRSDVRPGQRRPD